MRRVITVSLNGNSYQLDEQGYEALQAYLHGAEARLADNPDKAEIMADLEQAIAEKCAQFLAPHKNVVSAEEVARVLEAMGPVDGAQSDGAATSSSTERLQAPGSGNGDAAGGDAAAGGAARSESAGQSQSDGKAQSPPPLKRLYQIQEGAMISGVCNGFAAYFNIDVTIVRLIFVALAIVTGGAWILAYIVMMFVIPYAQTSEQHAAAHGWAFNTQELIDRAKQHYAQFKDGQQWRRRWRQQRRFWRQQQREWREQSRHWQQQWFHTAAERPQWTEGRSQDAGYAAYILGGVLIPLVAVCNAVLVIVMVLAIISLATKHAILGWTLPTDVPLWAAILIVVVLYQVVAAPLRAARHAGFYHSSLHRAWFALWGAVAWLAFVTLFAWLAWRHWPEVQQFFHQFKAVPESLMTFVTWLSPSRT